MYSGKMQKGNFGSTLSLKAKTGLRDRDSASRRPLAAEASSRNPVSLGLLKSRSLKYYFAQPCRHIRQRKVAPLLDKMVRI